MRMHGASGTRWLDHQNACGRCRKRLPTQDGDNEGSTDSSIADFHTSCLVAQRPTRHTTGWYRGIFTCCVCACCPQLIKTRLSHRPKQQKQRQDATCVSSAAGKPDGQLTSGREKSPGTPEKPTDLAAGAAPFFAALALGAAAFGAGVAAGAAPPSAPMPHCFLLASRAFNLALGSCLKTHCCHVFPFESACGCRGNALPEVNAKRKKRTSSLAGGGAWVAICSLVRPARELRIQAHTTRTLTYRRLTLTQRSHRARLPHTGRVLTSRSQPPLSCSTRHSASEMRCTRCVCTMLDVCLVTAHRLRAKSDGFCVPPEHGMCPHTGIEEADEVDNRHVYRFVIAHLGTGAVNAAAEAHAARQTTERVCISALTEENL